MRKLFYILPTLFLLGCAHHPVDCALGFPWSDCLEGTAGYNNSGGSDTRENQLKIDLAKKQSLENIETAGSLKQKLIQLEELRKQGLITEEEYSRLRKKYLNNELDK